MTSPKIHPTERESEQSILTITCGRKITSSAIILALPRLPLITLMLVATVDAASDTDEPISEQRSPRKSSSF